MSTPELAIERRTLGEKVVRGLIALALVALASAALWSVSFLLAPVALALVGFYCLLPVVNLLEHKGVPRALAVAGCFLFGIAVLAVLGFTIWPALESWLHQEPQVGQPSPFEVRLSARLDGFEAAAEQMWPRFDWHHSFVHVRQILDAEGRRLTEDFPTLVSRALSHAGIYLLAPVITFFLLLEGAEMNRRLLSFVPNRYFETVLVLLHRVDRQIAAYLRGAASESAMVAALLSLLLLVAGMPHPLLFGCLYGVLNVIPLVGPLIGASAGLLYALMDPAAPSLGWLVGCYLATYGLDAAFINPWLVGKNLHLHPLTVLVGVSIGGSLGGIVGMLVVIPLIAIGKAVAATLHEALRRQSA